MPTRKSKEFSDEELLQPIRDFFSEHGRMPKENEYTKDNGFPFAIKIYTHRFGKKKDIMESAKLLCRSVRTYTKESVLELIRPIANFLGRCPYYDEINEYSKLCANFPSTKIIDKFFDGMGGLADALYLEHNMHFWDKKKIISSIYPLVEKLGRCPTVDEVNEYNKSNISATSSTIYRNFESWETFISYFGDYIPNIKHWTEEEVLEEVKQEADKKGRMLFLFEVNELSKTKKFPSITSIRKYCDGLNEIAKLIGHKPNMKNKSRVELEILEYVKTLTDNDVYSGDRIALQEANMKGKELDIYIPLLNIGIECNGNYWHSYNNNRSPKNKAYHLNKTLAANNKGISLCHIWEEEWQSNQKEIKEYLFNFINNIPQEHVGIVDRMKPLNYINSTILKYTNPKLIDVGREKCWNCGTIIYEEVKDENPSNI